MPMVNKVFATATLLLLTAFAAAQNTTSNARPRAADLGLKVGILPTGPLDAGRRRLFAATTFEPG